MNHRESTAVPERFSRTDMATNATPKIKSVIASVAKQSSAAAPKAGLLRYARNDRCGKRFVQFWASPKTRRVA